MKKSLVALATLAATSAFAQVTITGLVDLGYNVTDFKGNKVTTAGSANGSATSNVTFLGVEDLGGGLSAKWRWEIDPDLANTVGKTSGTAATGTTSNVTTFLSNGYSYLGLAGSFGEVQFGSLNYSTLYSNGEGNSGFATAIGSGYRVTSADAVRAQNLASFESPSFGGFSVRYVFGTKNDMQSNSGTKSMTGNLVNQTNGRDASSELSAKYDNNGLIVRASALQVKQYGKINTAYPLTHFPPPPCGQTARVPLTI